MRRIFKIAAIAASITGFSACDRDFVELNRNPNAYVDPDINPIFTYALTNANGGSFELHRANLIYAGNMIQHFASFGYSGDKYTYSSEWSGAFFDMMYTNAVKELTQLLAGLPEEDGFVNHRSMVRIMRVYTMHRITDLYGDVPYFDAGYGYLQAKYAPVYDQQSAIYADMLKELDESVSALNPAAESFGSADVLFNGDIDKWRKFASSLMLRLGMRLTKVDPAKAEEYVKKAIAAGVFMDTDGLGALLAHSDGNNAERNPNANPLINEDLQGGERPNNKLSKTFVDHLQLNSDPRLRIIAKLEATDDNTPENQLGLPNGSDAASVPGSLTAYSNLNTSTISRYQTPSVFISTAEVYFLLAEAALRNWYAENPSMLYEKGISMSIELFNEYTVASPVAAIAPSEASTFISAHALNTGGSFEQQMEQIHTQLWVNLLMNEIEAFSNWRRTGYPKLTPLNYPGNLTGGTIPRRLRYSENEIGSNNTNYNNAIAQQGPDDFTTRVWWDKP